MNKDMAPATRRRPKLWLLIALAFFVAAIVAFATFDANRPEALVDAREGTLPTPTVGGTVD